MQRFSILAQAERGPGHTRAALRGDVLYNAFRFREVFITVSKKLLAPIRIQDGFVQQLWQEGFISQEEKALYEKAVLDAHTPIDQLDHLCAEELYRHIHGIRLSVLGAEPIEKLQEMQARTSCGFTPNGIDQSDRKRFLLEACGPILFALTDPTLFSLLKADIQLSLSLGKKVWVLCSQDGDLLLSRRLMESLLQEFEGIRFAQSLDALPQSACLFAYGEEGFTACRGLALDAVVHGIPQGYAAQAVTNLWAREGCVVYIPAGFDITPFVPMTAKTRLTYSHLAQLHTDYGDWVYRAPEELYKQFPRHFVNIYAGGPTGLPVVPQKAEGLQAFDRQLDENMTAYLSGFENADYHCAYFDEDLNRQPISYDPQVPQKGILVQAAKLRQAAGAAILGCEKGITPRQMFRKAAKKGTALVSNFLFFLTPKLGVLYNDLRADRPYEQADAASGHLDYMLRFENGKRIESFPLFQKTGIAMTDEGKFLFFNFRLGGGRVDISGISYRWESSCVDSDDAPIRLYTPYYSCTDLDAPRDTYSKPVGHGRINVVMLRDRVTCVRQGDVLLPSVGVVLSLTETAAAPLLAKLSPLSDGYYDVTGLELAVELDAPASIDPQLWAKVSWAYGGGLTLIRDGVGLCDGDHMQSWFDTEGWSSPLSRQTQESNLHSLVKHPRTAIGCTKQGELVVLVYSGRTWRSTGADYREMIHIARQLFPDIHYLMNCDGGGSAMLGLVHDGEFMELSFPSTSGGSCAGQVRPINTVFYMPIENQQEDNQ